MEKLQKILTMIILGMVLASCGTSTPTQSVVETIEPTQAMSTSSANSLPIPSITWTPLPTLSVQEAQDKVRELLETNAGCELPCWWGIVPNATTAENAQSILEPFLGLVMSKTRYEFSDTGGSLLMRPQSNGFQIGIQYLVTNGIVSMVYINTKMIDDTGDLVYNDPLYQEIMFAYTLRTVLSTYGKPDQIFVRSFSDLAGELNPTQILLCYADKGIVAQYFSRNLPMLDAGNATLWTCPPESHVSLRLFEPHADLSLEQILAIDDSYYKYKDISSATNMDIDSFFQIYRNYDEKALDANCPNFLVTREDIWPNEYQNP